MSKKPMLDESHFFIFDYNEKGYGDLILYRHTEETTQIMRYRARTGSVSKSLHLRNSIRPGLWTIKAPPVMTKEVGMYIKPGQGWKVRMWTPEGQWSHHLIHPDGNKPGTLGCIGIIGTDALGLMRKICTIFETQDCLPVFISKVNGGSMKAAKEYFRDVMNKNRETLKTVLADSGAHVSEGTVDRVVETAKKVIEYSPEVSKKKGLSAAKDASIANSIVVILVFVANLLGMDVGANLETAAVVVVGSIIGLVGTYAKKKRENQSKVLDTITR